LSPQAQAILRKLKAETGSSEWVFESGRKAGHHLTTLKTANQGILRRQGMKHWTPHDLRRTAASRMSEAGVSRIVLQAILNHKDRSVTAIYDRHAYHREKRDALCAWGRRVEEIASGGPQASTSERPSLLKIA
jgi:integrase